MEVQTLYTDDGIALRFADQGAGTGATPDETRRAPGWDELWVEPSEVEELLVERLSTAAVFSSVFRESAARALLLPRRSPDGRAPLWQQRLRAQNLLSAVRQFAGFPIVLETYRTCLQDIFDVPALVGLLQAIERREVRVHEVETRAASPFSRSLAFAYVASYMYEVDNPVAERRAQALSLDRNLLRELLGQDELRSVLSTEVLDEVEAELQCLIPPYQATDADRLHDVLRRVGALSGDALRSRVAASPAELATWLEVLARSRRAVRMRVAEVDAWVAVEDVAAYRDGLGCAPPSGLPASLLAPIDRPLEGLVAKYARSHGPFSRAEVAAHLGLPEVAVDAAVTALLRAGRLSEGAYRPGRSGSELCDTEVLRRIRRRMMAQLRSEVAPVDGAALARFWLGWHGVLAVDEARGRRPTPERLLEVVAQLEGFALPLGELEAVILPARIPGYQPRMLDELMTSGLVVWVGVAAIGSKDGRVALYRREKLSALAAPRDLTTALLDSLEPLQQHLLAHFASRGATFFGEVELGAATRDEALAALWDLVWMGWLTNDTLGPVRSLSAGAAARSRVQSGGRWSLVGAGLKALPAAEVALARAAMLFERWGLVARGVLDGETLPGGFAGLYDTLRAMEEVGRVRRGHFVDGLEGAQMALPGVVDRLRAARSQTDGKVVLVSAIDPASPWGNVMPWPTDPLEGTLAQRRDPAGGTPRGLARKAGALVALEDGVPVFWFGPGGKRIASMPAAREDEGRAVRALMAWARTGREGVTLVTEIDGGAVRGTRWEALLREAGFVGDYRGMVLAKRPEVVARSEVERRFDSALSELRARTGNVAPAPVPGAWPEGPWGASRSPAPREDSTDIEGGPDEHGGRVRKFSFRRARSDRPS
jgi:ATP-dependent Lhr-like helicase